MQIWASEFISESVFIQINKLKSAAGLILCKWLHHLDFYMFTVPPKIVSLPGNKYEHE